MVSTGVKQQLETVLTVGAVTHVQPGAGQNLQPHLWVGDERDEHRHFVVQRTTYYLELNRHTATALIYVYYIRRSSMRYNKSQTDTLTNIRTAFTYCRERKTHGQINQLLEQFGSEVRSGLDNHRRWSLVHILTISICIPARHRGTKTSCSTYI